MFTWFLYIITLVLLVVSLIRNRSQTRTALKRAYQSFMNIMPLMLAVFMIIGMIMAWLSPEIIAASIGQESGIVGMLLAAAAGSIVMLPGFVAFPLADSLLQTGAGLTQVAAFLSTLMIVGLATLPLEITYFGRRASIVRNAAGFVFSLIIAGFIGWML